MRPHEIREIKQAWSISDVGNKEPYTRYWNVRFRRYGIAGADDMIVVKANDEIDAFHVATKELESIR